MANTSDQPRVGLRDLSRFVADDLDVGRERAQHIIEAVLGAITREMVAGRTVSIGKFGRFDTYTRPARGGYDPIKRTSTQIPESSYARFRPSRALHAIVRAGDVAASIHKSGRGQKTGEA